MLYLRYLQKDKRSLILFPRKKEVKESDLFCFKYLLGGLKWFPGETMKQSHDLKIWPILELPMCWAIENFR